MRTHAMTTLSQSNIFNPKKLFLGTKHSLPDPIEQTCATLLVKDEKWKKAMLDELEALERNQTSKLVETPHNRIIIGCKWIFKLIKNSGSSISHYKSRLVAKGFNQRLEMDFKKTFSPVVKLVTIWVMLTLLVSNNWQIS